MSGESRRCAGEVMATRLLSLSYRARNIKEFSLTSSASPEHECSLTIRCVYRKLADLSRMA